MTSTARASTPSASLRIPRTAFWALGGLVLAGALLRFATLGDQSLWYDEGLTRNLVLKPFGDLVASVADTENTPPLFYALTHFVTQVIEADEVGLRLVSAIAGTATIPLAFLAGRELNGARAGLYAAGLVAANPLLFWFSQEARSYALLGFLSALAFVCFLVALRRPSGWALAGWAFASAAGVATHYFAVFPLAAEAAWLVFAPATRARRRGVLLAVVGAGAAVVAIAPVAISQEASGRAQSIANDEPLSQRIAQVPKQLLVGYDGPLEGLVTTVAVLLVLVAATGLWRIRSRPAVLATIAVAAASIVVPMLAAFAGADFLNTRNVLPGLVPVLALVGAGFSELPRRWGAAAATALVAVGLATAVAVSTTPAYQRTDWRSLAGALGDSPETRLLVASPAGAEVPLAAYRAGIVPAGAEPLTTDEIVLAATAIKTSAGGDATPPRPDPPEVPGFELAAREERNTYTLYRYRSQRPVEVPTTALGGAALVQPGSVLVVPGG